MPPQAPRTVLTGDDVARALTRIAHEIVERQQGTDGLVLVGLRRGGVWVAEEFSDRLAEIGSRPRTGSLDVSFHRDDIGLRPIVPGSVTDIPGSLDGAVVVLCDDVLYTGRTVRAALEALNEYGRPSAVRLAVMVDRGHRELPIRPDFVGKNLPTSSSENVSASSRWRGDRVKHLLSIEDLSAADIHRLMELADHMAEVSRRPIPKVPALRGRTIVSLFFEDSTRTRTSFDTAAKRLSADTMSFAVSASSVNKGESLRDTVETITAMGVDAFVVRHRSSGAPQMMTRWTTASVVNAGDGWHQHPTQALLDTYTIRSRLNRRNGFDGLTIAIVGDIKHSRVARSNVQAFSALGARVVLVAPPTLLPPVVHDWPVEVSHDLDSVLGDLDVLYLLRVQRERMDDGLLPNLREYVHGFGLTARRAAQLAEHALVMHPGPMNRGVEMAVDPAELPGSVVLNQVTNGVAVRMAVLFDLLGAGTDLAGSDSKGLG